MKPRPPFMLITGTPASKLAAESFRQQFPGAEVCDLSTPAGLARAGELMEFRPVPKLNGGAGTVVVNIVDEG